MYTLSLEVINKCNLNCNYCYLGEKKNSYMSLDTAQRAIDIATHETKKQHDKTLTVYFIGGEPLMAFETIKAVVMYTKRQCDNNNLKYQFSTTINGTLLTEEVITYFIKNKFNIKVSLDGAEKVHDLNRKDYSGNGSFNKIMEKFELLKLYEQETGKKFSIASVITNNNYLDYKESFVFLLSLGCEALESGIDYYCTWSEEQLKGLKEQVNNVFHIYKSYIQEKQKVFYWNLWEQSLRSYMIPCSFYSCKAGLTKIYVTVDGGIYTCLELPEFMIGHVDTGLDVQKIREIVYREEHLAEKCKNCKYINNCRTKGCQVANYEVNKNIYTPVEINCRVTKWIYELIEENLTEEQLDKMRTEYERRYN